MRILFALFNSNPSLQVAHLSELSYDLPMNTRTAEEIGQCIARMRKMLRVTQRELAEKMDTHQSMVARWEKGQIFPREDTVQRIAEILGVSVDDLMSGKPGHQPVKDSGVEAELEALWGEVHNLSQQDRQVLKSVLEAMLMRSRVKDAVQFPIGIWRESRAS